MGKESGGKLKQKDVDKLVQAQKDARVNQETPFGSLTYSGDTATTTLSPEQQALLQQTQMAQSLAGETAIGRFGDLGSGREAVERATFDRALGLLDPVYTRNEDRLRERLANQGLPQSSGAFTRELDRFGTGRDQAYEQLALASILAGGNEETRQINAILGLLGAGAPVAGLPVVNTPQIEIPFAQPGGRASGAQGFAGGAASGAAALAPTGNPWAIGAGAVGGGLLGLFAR